MGYSVAIKLKSICRFFANMLNSDTVLASDLTSAGFTKTLAVYYGVDVNNPPKESDAPFIVISPLSQIIGHGTGTITYNWSLTYGCSAKGYSTSILTGVNVLLSQDKVDLMTEAILKSLSSANNYGVGKGQRVLLDTEYQYEQDQESNFVVGVLTASLAVDNVAGYIEDISI